MRQRHIAGRDEIIENCKDYLIADIPEGLTPLELRAYMGQKCREFIAASSLKEVYAELGSGKGKFITELAAANPDKLYIAAEGGFNVWVRIAQKAKNLGLENLFVVPVYIYTVSDFFDENSLNGIYLNFSDPWPKDRDARRRLTWRGYLTEYQKAARGGFLEFKTDNDALFDFSLEELAACGLSLERCTRDLHSSEWAGLSPSTEYEAKFSSLGKSINYFRVQL